jgi:hypothetical protein
MLRLTAAYDLAFEPAELAGKPVEVQINYTFTFPAPKPPAPEPPPPPPAAAQKNRRPLPVENFTGVLVERGTRLPMAGILVTVYRTEGETPVGFENITDASGNFHFFDLAPGEWKVRIEPPSYYPFRTTEEIARASAPKPSTTSSAAPTIPSTSSSKPSASARKSAAWSSKARSSRRCQALPAIPWP